MNTQKLKHSLSLFSFTAFVLLGLGSIDSNASSKAKANITNLKGVWDVRSINNELDYGLQVTFTVTNIGEYGIIKVAPWLTCSEGEWSKTQSLTFNAGETMNLTYFFDEPTVNVTNAQFGVKYSPN